MIAIEEGSKLEEAGIDNNSILIKINKADIQKKKGRDAMKILKKEKVKRPLTLIFSKEIKKSKDAEKEEEDTKKDGFGDDIEANQKVVEEPKFTSLWLKESEVSNSMFDDDHYFFGAGEYQDDFEEWLKDEATRLNIFGDKLVIEVMKAHERMAKEEKEKDKKEKKEEN